MMDKDAQRIFRVLVVEDDKSRIERFHAWVPDVVRLVVASSAGRAIGILGRDRGSVYGGIMLDHDLNFQALTAADRALSGADVVRTVIDCISPDVPVLIHSMNPEGSRDMTRMLEGAGFDVTVVPMDRLDKKALVQWLGEAYLLWKENE